MDGDQSFYSQNSAAKGGGSRIPTLDRSQFERKDEDPVAFKEDRVSKILNELKVNMQKGEPMSFETVQILQQVMNSKGGANSVGERDDLS